jgi:hypothetical protein
MERRKEKRFPFEITLNIQELYKQDYVKIEDLDEEFSVVNISKSGIGFACEHELPMDFYFNAKITIDEEEFFFTVLKIIRVEKQENDFLYGCEFVGLAEILSNTIEDLED